MYTVGEVRPEPHFIGLRSVSILIWVVAFILKHLWVGRDISIRNKIGQQACYQASRVNNVLQPPVPSKARDMQL